MFNQASARMPEPAWAVKAGWIGRLQEGGSPGVGMDTSGITLQMYNGPDPDVNMLRSFIFSMVNSF